MTIEERRRDQSRVRSRKYRLTHLDQARARSRAWFAANPDRARADIRAWRVAHPDAASQYEATRRARKRGATGSHTLVEWQEKCALFASLCVYCGEAKPLTRDHKIPLVCGGTHDIMNIVPSCRPCNSRKGTRTMAEFLAA